MSCYYRSGCYHAPWSRMEQENEQAQAQVQAQAQAQDQDQNQRNVFREIGNVHIDIDNENILVAVLVVVAVLTGSLDGTAVQSLLDRFVGSGATR